MRYCPYCGTELPDDVRFCARCGADVSSIQMPSQQPIPQPYIPPQQYPPQPPPVQPAYTPPPQPQPPHIPPPKKHSKTGGIVAVFLVVAIIIAGIVIISAQQSSYITPSPQPNPAIYYLLTHGNEGDVELYVYTQSSGKVYFYVDGEYQGVSNASSNSYIFCPTFSVSEGNHTFYAKKYDSNGYYQGSTSSITKYIPSGYTAEINLGTLP